MNPPHTIGLFRGSEVTPWLDDVARLRLSVFHDWPYLYDGDVGYERDYLAAYAKSTGSVFVLAFDGVQVVGASTGLPLADEASAFQQPFLDAALPVDAVFYFGESVLLPEYRGRGLGHAFFDHRETHARAMGRFRYTAFCAVDREMDDPRRPVAHRGNEVFWHKRGYQRQPDMAMHLPWEETGQGEVMHALTFWTRKLEQDA